MAYEPSEIMFAACLLFTDAELKKNAKDAETLQNFMAVAKKKASSGIKFGNDSIKKGFLDLMEPTDKGIKDLVVGMSAAISMRKEVPAKELKGSPSVYLTGNVWPKEVEKFRISAYGFEDYNSADVLFTYNGSKFYGVSLKKKPKPNAPEPTLINKAFDSVFEGAEFSKIRQQLVDARINYFADLVIQAVEKQKIIKKSDIKDFDKLKSTPAGRKELFEAKKRDKVKFDKSYIDTKGYSRSKKGYKDENTRDPNSMRFFVNKQLSDPKNPLWSQFIKIMNANSEMLGETLLNIILKTKMYEELSAKDLKKFKFGFFLVTGIGDVTKSNVSIQPAQVISLETTLCGLTRIDEKYSKQPYKVELNKAKKGQSDAAKIFMQLKRGNLVLLDLELRYKGAFTPQPQFQGTLNHQFKTLLKDECGI